MRRILLLVLMLVLLTTLVSAYHTNYNYRVYGSGYDVRMSGQIPSNYFAGFGVSFVYDGYYVGRLSPSYDYTSYYPYSGYRYNPYLTDSYRYPSYRGNMYGMMNMMPY